MIEIISLPGLIPYDDAQNFQLELVEKRILEEIPDTVLFLEHHPVITRGRGLQWPGQKSPKHMDFDHHSLPEGTEYRESQRGGDLTYHGPGQLVIYPIIKLTDRNIGAYLRNLERIMIGFLEDLGITAGQKNQATGVWIENKKIASIGVAVRRWVTYHGIALNCINPLDPFFIFSPCGFQPHVMTRLADWVPDIFLSPQWRKNLETKLVRRIEETFGEFTFQNSISKLNLKINFN